MTNLKRVMTEQYDTVNYTDTPYGVQAEDLFDGELFIADEYEWILLNNSGTLILTNVGYEDGDLGKYDKEALEFIEYLIKDAPEKGYIEEPSEEDTRTICELLGEDVKVAVIS